MSQGLVPFALLLGPTLAVSGAWANAGEAPAAGFGAGAVHLLREPDHLLAVVALALMAGRAAGRALVWTPVGLGLGMFAGAMLGSALPMLYQVETLNLASICILGGLVALGAPLPAAFIASCGLIFGWGHGYANVLDHGGQTPAAIYMAGVVAAASLVEVSISLLISVLRATWQHIAVRALASWLCAIGLMVLASRLA